jgi:hypothetical protein
MSDNHAVSAVAVVLGDGTAAFEPDVLATDLREVAGLYQQLRPHVDTAAWHATAPTGGWTMAQTVAHLDVMTATGLSAIDDALAGRRPVFDGIAERRGLEAWNEATIRRRLDEDTDLLDSLVAGLHRSAERAGQLTTAQLTATVELPIYNAPLTVVDLLGIQAFHPGLNHTAQVVDVLDRPPLWVGLEPATRHRMITRLVRALGYLYWPDRGGPEGLTIAIHIDGTNGGDWHVVGTPRGAEGGTGSPDNPDLTLCFRDLTVACRMFTGRLPMLRSLFRRDLRLRGDVRILRRFGAVFSSDG